MADLSLTRVERTPAHNHVAKCDCGWSGKHRFSAWWAEKDAIQHQASEHTTDYLADMAFGPLLEGGSGPNEKGAG